MEARDELFFRLLRFALGTEENCPKMHLNEWREMFQIAKKQAITGFIGSALKNIGGDVLIEKDAKSQDAFTDLIMDWMGEVVKIARRYQKVNNDVIDEFLKLESKGLQCCLLKGQGNAFMYPNHDSRTSGDIDVWVRFKDTVNTDGNIRKIIKMAKDVQPNSKASYHHIDIPDINCTPVEAHYRPQFLFSYWHNKHLQEYFNKHSDEQLDNKVKFGDKEISVPTPEFNIVFQLSHIYNHLFHEGIGLRQIIDYYYVLKAYDSLSNKSSIDWDKQLNYLGMHNIAGAIMWILTNEFGMPKSWAIVLSDKGRGTFVLNEILQGGNFGKSDKRYHFSNSAFGKNLQRLQRDCRLLSYFPSEALSEPIFRLWHAWWRYKHN
jgi:hypothetical protein